MIPHDFFNNIKTKIPILSLVIGSILIAAYILIDYRIYKNQISTISLENSLKSINEKEQTFNEQLNVGKHILLSIENNQIFEQYINNPTQNHTNLTNLFKQIIQSNTNLMQIRFIDNTGYEQIRIDRIHPNDTNIQIINKLQDKSKRYYFSDSINKQDKVWFSDLDLNIENGRIEKPFNPTYRVILPIKQNNKFNGILILNYFAQPILNNLFIDNSIYNYILIDKDGYILTDYENGKSWTKYQPYPSKINSKYIELLPTNIYHGNEFKLKKLNLPLNNQLYLIVTMSKKYQMQQEYIYYNRALSSLIIFFIFLVLVSLILYFILSIVEEKDKQIENLHEQSKEQDKILLKNSKQATMGNMVANIAHQWRQPLTIISLNNINLQRKIAMNTVDNEFLTKYIAKINTTIETMNQTIDDFADFFKPNKKKIDFTLNDAIIEAIKILQTSLNKNKINIKFENVHEYDCYSYKNELIHVLINVINNAQDAIQMNNINNGEIYINIKNKHKYCIITIEDNGGGIPQDIKEKIFNPYFTTKDRSRGTGIGLYMSKLIIEESFCGNIELKDKDNGTICNIKLVREV